MVGIEFLDGDEETATKSAIMAVFSGNSDRAEVRDDEDNLEFET